MSFMEKGEIMNEKSEKINTESDLSLRIKIVSSLIVQKLEIQLWQNRRNSLKTVRVKIFLEVVTIESRQNKKPKE